MKRSIIFAVGLGFVVAANALGVADHPNNVSANNADIEFGLVSIEHLSDVQRQSLQAKFRYWSAADSVVPQTPL